MALTNSVHKPSFLIWMLIFYECNQIFILTSSLYDFTDSTLNLFLACCSKNSSPNLLWFPNPYADAVFRLAWKWSLLSFPSIPPFASLSFCSQPDFLLYLLNLGTSPIRAKENSFTLNHHPPPRHWPCPCTVCIANNNLCHLHPKMHLIYTLHWCDVCNCTAYQLLRRPNCTYWVHNLINT